MRVFIVGASGFLGRCLLAALEDAGHDVLCGVRDTARSPCARCVTVDFTRDHRIEDWLPRLEGIHAVINCVGILREHGGQTFSALHEEAPRALFAACAQAGVDKVIQISALGADEGARSRYHLSKRRADEFLVSLPVAWTIVRPSLVFGLGGASARLFTALATLPVIPLPGDGEQKVQPIHIDDLTAALVTVVERDDFLRRHLDAVGPRAITFRDWIATLRTQLGLPHARFIAIPWRLVRAGTEMLSKIPGVLFDVEALDMLQRGNIAPPDAITRALGRPLRPLEQFIPTSQAPILAAAARLRWWLPLLRWSVALVWIATGIISLGIFPLPESYALLARVGVTGTLAPFALYGAAAIDLLFGVGTVLLQRRRWLWRAQIALVFAYSTVIAIMLPEFWLHPFGPLLKNVPLIVIIAFLHEFEER